MNNLVSVVIPTFNRPQELKQAVLSALHQTLDNIEVIVVIDGEAEETLTELLAIKDPRLRCLKTPFSRGAASARNFGVANASGQWIAFLDDDDEWLPSKLEKQLHAAQVAPCEFPIVSSYLWAHTPKGSYLLPRRTISDGEDLSEYLLSRRTLRKGDGFIQTSTIFTNIDLFRKVQFSDDLKRHQEWDWLLRAIKVKGSMISFVDEPLTIWNTEEERFRITNQNDWQYSLEWIKNNKSLVTSRAYAGFLMTVVSSIAARDKDLKAFFILLKESILSGKPQPLDYVVFLLIWLFPQNFRRLLRNSFYKLIGRVK
jgi:glycosyltransferase involved in cell wall biosynthesis